MGAGLESRRPEAWARLASRSPLSRELPPRTLFPVADRRNRDPKEPGPGRWRDFHKCPVAYLGVTSVSPDTKKAASEIL